MRKENVFILLLSTLVFSCTGLKARKNNSKNLKILQRKTLFEMKDEYDAKKKRDYRPSYPTDSSFKKGSFELKKLKIEEDENNIYFNIHIGSNFKNDWKMPGGWDVQMFDIYLNFGQGNHIQTISGRNVKLNGWDKAIIIAPVRKSRLHREISENNRNVYDDVSEGEDLVDDILVYEKAEIDKNVLTCSISKDKIPSTSKLKGIQVMVLGLDPYPVAGDKNTLARQVEVNASQWHFGGGSYGGGHPNVIDILGDNSSLSKYISNGLRTEFAMVDFIPIRTKK